MHDDEDDDDRSDDRLAWWDATLPALECILDCLPEDVQNRVCERLRLVAVIQQDKGQKLASFYSRALSGEPPPGPGPVSRITLDD
jgi:hypothetical protein